MSCICSLALELYHHRQSFTVWNIDPRRPTSYFPPNREPTTPRTNKANSESRRMTKFRLLLTFALCTGVWKCRVVLRPPAANETNTYMSEAHDSVKVDLWALDSESPFVFSGRSYLGRKAQTKLHPHFILIHSRDKGNASSIPLPVPVDNTISSSCSQGTSVLIRNSCHDAHLFQRVPAFYIE